MGTIVRMVFGSHLYGTATPESDKDYKGIFMPTKRDILLGKISKSYSETTGDDRSKNSAEDVDTEIYSFHYFIKLACEGQTVALDMLHAPDDMLVETSPLWETIKAYRRRFYTRNLSAFVGYARRQAGKYGCKGSRLSAAKDVIEYLKTTPPESTLGDCWNMLPNGEHIHMDQKDDKGLRLYQVCGKKFQETARVGYVLPILERFYESYGARAKQAEENKGIDWKAISHAIRAALQVEQLLTEKTITFPLREAEFLTAVKQGKVDYSTVAAPYLETLMDRVETLSEESNLPQKVDRKFWDDFIVGAVEKYVL